MKGFCVQIILVNYKCKIYYVLQITIISQEWRRNDNHAYIYVEVLLIERNKLSENIKVLIAT